MNVKMHRVTSHLLVRRYAEDFNSRIQAIKSAARGFRNFANYRILSFCGKLNLQPENTTQ